jgi:predicted MFS family arabinose efflux permease
LATLEIVGSALTATFSSFALIFTARAVTGLATLAVNPVALSLIGDLYPPAQRGRATMAMTIGQFAGMSAAFGLGGWLLTEFKSQPNSWRAVMLCLTAPLLLVALVTLAMREPARSAIEKDDSSGNSVLRGLWRHRKVMVPLLTGIVMTQVGLEAVFVWAAPAFSRDFALSANRIGQIMAFGILVSGILGPICGGALADMCQRRIGVSGSMRVLSLIALASLPFAAFAVLSNPSAASTLLIAFLVIVSAAAVMATVVFSVIVPNDIRGVCMSVLAASCVLMTGLSPLAVSLLSQTMGGTTAIGRALAMVVVVTGVITTAAFGLGSRHVKE